MGCDMAVSAMILIAVHSHQKSDGRAKLVYINSEGKIEIITMWPGSIVPGEISKAFK
jgi:hypothetical protein